MRSRNARSSSKSRGKAVEKFTLRIETLEPRAMLSAESALFVGGVYDKLLSRAPDEGGAQYWNGLLDSGVSREHVVMGVQGSEEFRASQLAADCAEMDNAALIEHFYGNFLGRAADDGGRDYWISKLDADGRDAVLAGILGSSESEQQIQALASAKSADDEVTPFDSGLQSVAGIPFVVGSPELKQISAAARLYLPTEPDYYGATANGSASNQDSITQAFGYTFVTFYDSQYRVNVARRLIAGDAPWESFPLSNKVETNDNHRTPNIAVSQDGKIHLMYGMHSTGGNQNNFRYRVSVANAATATNFTATLFSSAQRNWLDNANDPLKDVTYPIFVMREVSPTYKQLMMFWRKGISGNGDIYWSAYNHTTGTWGSKIHVIKGMTGGTYTDPTGTAPNSPTSTRNPYPNDIVVDGNEIHLTWTWREANPNPAVPGLIVNHDLMYAKSVDGGFTWTNTDGDTVGTSGAGSYKMDINSEVKVWDLNYNWDVINSNTSAVDSQGNTHVVMMHGSTDSGSSPGRYWHYVRTGETWTRTMIPFAIGTRPKMFIDPNTDTVYVAGALSGVLKLFASNKGTNDWDTWTQIYTSAPTLIHKNDGFNGRLSGDGRTLWLLAQRAGAAADSTSSVIETVKFTLDPNV